MKLTRAQLNAIKEKARENKAAETDDSDSDTDTTTSTQSMEDIKKILAQKKAEEAQNNTTPSKKSQLKDAKRRARSLAQSVKSPKVNWKCSIGDLVQIPSDTRIRPSVQEKLDEDSFGIVVKISEDSRSGRRSAIENDSTQAQVLTGGGFRWYYVKSLRTV